MSSKLFLVVFLILLSFHVANAQKKKNCKRCLDILRKQGIEGVVSMLNQSCAGLNGAEKHFCEQSVKRRIPSTQAQFQYNPNDHGTICKKAEFC
ncbi:unnamed protein product [Caenorhabditis angaria]|uniref:Saposin B-type domain-containing protein n=1 Tax=Caenorhabditis angaria TaxID=860376 RepID=A0A9P1N2Q9_9PELO|nr:unnamed protein product [Caenorhabditis angaria]